MMPEWITVAEFAERTNRTVDTIYSLINREKKKNNPDFKKKYKKDGNIRLVNYSYTTDLQKKTQVKFENLYYSLLDRLDNERQVAMAISKNMDATQHCIYIYLRDHFISSRVSKRRLQYIDAMEKALVVLTHHTKIIK